MFVNDGLISLGKHEAHDTYDRACTSNEKYYENYYFDVYKCELIHITISISCK